ncbi:MAG: helix-turn-helix domain-containing protein [Acidobacteriia bacterium]|nr:helix-turn-helix domain-containing protein [Terriglobia bacterium]
MSRPRGNKTSKAERAERQAKALELMKTGATQESIAEVLGVSRMTFWRDLQAIEARYVEGSQEDVAAFKQSQYEALIRIESATAEGSIEPDVANALVRVRDSVARLLGLNAPERKVVGHVDADIDPAKLVGYRKFLYHTRHLSEEDVNAKVFPYCDSLPPSETPAHLMVPSEAMKRGYE